MKNPILIVLFVLVTSIGFAQSKFSNDPEQFVKNLTKFLETSDRNKAKQVMIDFEEIWLGTGLSMEDKRQIIKVCQNMEALKFRAFPEYGNYIFSIIHAHQKSRNKTQVESWHSIVEGLSEKSKKKKELRKFLNFSVVFFFDNSLNETRSKSVKWQSSNADYSISLEKGQPKISFVKLDMLCYSKGDSTKIYNTRGVYYPLETRWVGEEGKVTWEKSGFSKDEVYAKLKTYEIDMRRPEYSADSVLFGNTNYYDTELFGVLSDKIIAVSNQSRISYPRFDSYEKRLPIRNIIDKVDYDGGFSQYGNRFIGKGTPENPARLVFYKNEEPFLVAYSNRFLIKMNKEEEEEEEKKWFQKKTESKRAAKNRIVSSEAKVVFYLEEDSIVHPGIKFNLFTDDRLVNLIRSKDDITESPYFNSFHQIEMKFELLKWKIDDPIIEFTSIKTSSNKSAEFRSLLYFKDHEFEKMMGIGSRHPLSTLKRCLDAYGTDYLMLEDVATCLGLSPTQVEAMMIRYSTMGYVNYDDEVGGVQFYPKLMHHVQAKSKRSDYDVIRIASTADKTTDFNNATLNLLNYDLSIKGVDRIILSDSHRLQIYPGGRRIVMKKNRDFDFAGIVSSGKVDFHGKNFSFKYDDFNIKMPVIDSLQIWADTKKKDKLGNKLEARVRTLIETLTGELKIDRPNNKSGIKSIPEYPIFSSFKESYAYYQKPEIFDNVYKKDNFYFELEPFEFDSLDDFSNKQINFKGTFTSANIFRDLPENLRLQEEDYSLGFKRLTGGEGEAAYGGVGTFENEIWLSNYGLRGDGLLRYVTSITQSNDFIFFPDSTNAITQHYDIEEQVGGTVEFPNVTADTVKMHWMPYLDYMNVNTMPKKKPIKMFAGIAEHTGQLIYNPKELIGSGKNSFEGANLYSNKMLFKFQEIFADTADFEIAKDLFDALDFSSKNLNAYVNFKDRKADFKSNEGGSLTVFDVCQYQAFLDRFSWLMDADEVEFSSGGGEVNDGADDLQLEGAEFTSIHPDQDSLAFYAKAATYSLAEKRITAKDVEFIQVADAEIFPIDGRVVIRKEANMQTLEAAKVVANRKLRYHTIKNSDIKITGKWGYSGNGLYDYTDEAGAVQTIELDHVGVDSTKQTFATGEIPEDYEFTLSPNFDYKGKVRLEAVRENLTFEGYSRVKHDCKDIPKSWFSFESEIDPSKISIDIDDGLKADDGEVLTASLMIPTDSNTVYTSFLNKPYSKMDIQVNDPTGYLIFDKESNEYRISTYEKLNEQSLPGNYISLNKGTCISKGVGKFELMHKMGHVKVMPVGNYSHNTVTGEVDVDVLMAFNFLFDENTFQVMSKSINEDAELEAVSLDRPTYEIGLRDIVGKDKADDMIGKMNLGKNVRLPDELKSALFLNEVKLKFDKDDNVFYSKGKIGVGNVLKEQVNRKLDGGIIIKLKRSGTEFTVYLEKSPREWYLFNYRSSTGFMKVFSSNKDFIASMDAVKNDKRRIKAGKENKQYTYIRGTKRMQSQFKKLFDAYE